MNKLITYFVRQGTFVNLVTLFTFVIGIYSIVKIRREVFPNINFDIVMVTTPFPGGAAESVEKLITNPLEQDLREVDGIKKMTSVSVEGQSVIVLQLDPDQVTDKEAEADIEDVVDNFKALPEDAEDPIVTVLETKLRPIITVSLSGDNLTEEDLRAAAKKLEREIEALPEVARVDYDGLRDFEVKVEAIPAKLRAYRLSLQDLMTALQRQNVSVPGGILEAASDEDGLELIVRTVGEFEGPEDIEETVVRANALAQTIKIKDVANVTLGFEREKLRYRTNGKPSINLTVLKKDAADAISLVDQVRKRVTEVQPSLLPGLEVSFINDLSYFVRRRINVLANNLMVGLALVLVVLSIILPWRVAAVTAFGIPFAFLGALAIFHFGDVSLNMLSLMGLIIVVGMLVDDAIVVTENAQAEMEKGKDPETAAIEGTQGIWAPVTASVMTTIMAFAPMMFMSGIFGKFVKFIPLGVIICLAISLVECFFILPHHVAAWVRVAKSKKNSGPGLFARLWDSHLLPAYAHFLRGAVKLRYLVVLLATLGVVGSIMFAREKMDFILFPPGAIDTFFIQVEAPVGTPLGRTEQLIKPFEEAIAELPKNELLDYTTAVGVIAGDGGDPTSRKRGGEYAQITVSLSAETERDRRALDIIDDLKARVARPEELVNVVYQRQQGGPPVGKPVSLGIRGESYPELSAAAEDLKKELRELEGVFDIQDSYIVGKEEIKLVVKAGEAAAAGLSVRDVGTAVRAAFEGISPTSIRTLDEEIDVRVTLAGQFRSSEETLRKLEIPNQRGNLIPLPNVATWTKNRGISVFEHENNQRQVRVTAEIDTEKTTSRKVNQLMRDKLPEIQQRHPKVGFFFGGEEADTQESIQTLVEAFGFAFFGIVLLMILLFKNLYQPLVIALTIPLGVTGVIWTFYAHDMPLTFLAIIGIIALAGVIVNNAIVLVDFANKAKDAGLERKEAVMEAARRRLRPIVLTTLTTVVGILPTAYGIGGLDPFVVPIALALGWGVGFGSFLTTCIFPPMLVVVEDLISAIQRPFR